jgi:hypothetical protein
MLAHMFKHSTRTFFFCSRWFSLILHELNFIFHNTNFWDTLHRYQLKMQGDYVHENRGVWKYIKKKAKRVRMYIIYGVSIPFLSFKIVR